MRTQNRSKDITRRTIMICCLAWFIPSLAKWLVGKLSERQARAAFHSAYEFMLKGKKRWFKPKSSLWFVIFDHWLASCDREELVKGLFFEVNYLFVNSKGQDVDNPLKSAAIEKWLTFLTNGFDLKVQNTIWDLYWNWGVQVQWRGFKLISERKDHIVEKLIDAACTPDDARRAWDFANSRESLGGNNTELCRRADDKIKEIEGENEWLRTNVGVFISCH